MWLITILLVAGAVRLAWILLVPAGQYSDSVWYDAAGKEVIMRWDFVEAYPVKWVGPQFQASGNAVAIETLELAHRGMKAG